MPESLQDFYQNKVSTLSQSLSVLNRRYNTLSYARLAVFLIGIGVSYLLFQQNIELGLLTGAIFMAVFVWLIYRHTQVAEVRDFEQRLLELNQKEQKVLTGDRSGFPNGENYIDPSHAYSYDLDFFGEGSLFQALNRSETLIGEQRLVDFLTEPLQDVEEIQERQGAVQALAVQQEWSQHFQATGKGAKGSLEAQQQLQQWLDQPPFLLHNQLFQSLLWILPGLMLLSLVIMVWQWFPEPISAPVSAIPSQMPLVIFLLNLAVVGLRLNQSNQEQNRLGQQSKIFGQYAELLACIEKLATEAPLLNRLQQSLREEEIEASTAIGNLAKLSYYLDQRLNMIAGIVLNGLLLWDYQCIIRLERWKEHHHSLFPGWLDVIAEVEALNVLGRFSFNHPDFTFPAVQAGAFQLSAKALGHPLLKAATRVDNDFTIAKGQIDIVTGANMAGKSTFLRTVGSNLVLAMSGAPVCAQSFQFSPIPLITSMRTADSLKDSESYFYAELKQLKRIIDLLETQDSIFVIIDEMLRGTNSRDKQTGSYKFIEQILQRGAAGLVATHDLGLGKLAEEYPGQIGTKRFEVHIEGEKLDFDYLLKEGISQNLNATLLMRQMGIMP